MDARNVISGNGGVGISIGSGGTANIQGNLIGTDVTGNADLGNVGDGIAITGGSGTAVGGTTAASRNVISGNSGAGIRVSTATGTSIRGNYIGVNISGVAPIPNGVGIELQNVGAGTVVGGSGVGNVISGNAGDGINFTIDANAVVVQGNLIGTDFSGVSAVPNSRNGIDISGAGNTIGGVTPETRNVISGNASAGVSLLEGFTPTALIRPHDNVILGNYIGTNASGTSAVPNVIGIEVWNAFNNVIGGVAAGAGNVISGNLTDGVLLTSGGSNQSLLGNLIGTNATGAAAVQMAVTAYRLSLLLRITRSEAPSPVRPT